MRSNRAVSYPGKIAGCWVEFALAHAMCGVYFARFLEDTALKQDTKFGPEQAEWLENGKKGWGSG
jgi:hypothetical protein